jgi:3-hydroxyisobutyrate dehydrogenase-like beta-hydroxyacid dehydrogenase
MIGFGGMVASMALRLVGGGHEVVVRNRSPEPVERLEAEGSVGARSLDELLERLKSPRAIWMSLPAGEATESTVKQPRGAPDTRRRDRPPSRERRVAGARRQNARVARRLSLHGSEWVRALR